MYINKQNGKPYLTYVNIRNITHRAVGYGGQIGRKRRKKRAEEKRWVGTI